MAGLRRAWGLLALFRPIEDAQLAVVHPFVIVGRIELGEAPGLRGEVHLRVGFAYEGKLFALWHGQSSSGCLASHSSQASRPV